MRWKHFLFFSSERYVYESCSCSFPFPLPSSLAPFFPPSSFPFLIFVCVQRARIARFLTEQRRWIAISNNIMACSVTGKDKVGLAWVFFGSFCVSEITGGQRLTLFIFISVPLSPPPLFLLFFDIDLAYTAGFEIFTSLATDVQGEK